MKASALGVGAFFVPFAFIFHPELLMVGDLTEILFAFSSVAMALFLISTGLVGFIGRPLNPVVRAGLILIGAAGIFTTGILCAALITVGLTIVAAVYRWGGRNNPSTKIHNRKSLSPADLQTVFEDSAIKNQAYRMGRIELPEKLFFVLSIFSCGVLYFTNIQNSMWGIWAIFICMLALASLAYIRHYPKEQAPLYSDD